MRKGEVELKYQGMLERTDKGDEGISLDNVNG